MTEILLLGSFHFGESSRDFYTPEIQRELNSMAESLLRFDPDAVAVEAAAHQQNAVDAAYAKFSIDDLKDKDKMKNETLGQIHIFNTDCPMKYNNESIQIGFRLAKMNGLSCVYAIDDDSCIDGEVFAHPSEDLANAISALSHSPVNDENKTMSDVFRYYNGTEWTLLNHICYLRANEMGSSTDYLGTRPVAQWYERNLKIFSNIQRLSKQYKRIFIVYGAGHLQILKDLINADDSLRLADTIDYLK